MGAQGSKTDSNSAGEQPNLSYYELLQVSEDATQDEIKVGDVGRV